MGLDNEWMWWTWKELNISRILSFMLPFFIQMLPCAVESSVSKNDISRYVRFFFFLFHPSPVYTTQASGIYAIFRANDSDVNMDKAIISLFE